MRLLSLPTQELNKYCALHGPAYHYSGYKLWGNEFSINYLHNQFTNLIPELTAYSFFSITAQYYNNWASAPHRIITNVTY